MGLGYTYLNDSVVMAYQPGDEPYWRSQLSDEKRQFMNEGTHLIPGGILIGDGLNRQYIGLSRIGIKFTYFLF